MGGGGEALVRLGHGGEGEGFAGGKLGGGWLVGGNYFIPWLGKVYRGLDNRSILCWAKYLRSQKI